MVRETVISNWLAVVGEPDILVAGKDKRFIGEIPQGFCTSHNITLKTSIPRHHQSLGETELTHAHFRGIVDRIIGNRKSNCSPHKGWGGIFGYGFFTPQFTGAEIWWIYSGEARFLAGAKITDWGGG